MFCKLLRVRYSLYLRLKFEWMRKIALENKNNNNKKCQKSGKYIVFPHQKLIKKKSIKYLSYKIFFISRASRGPKILFFFF